MRGQLVVTEHENSFNFEKSMEEGSDTQPWPASHPVPTSFHTVTACRSHCAWREGQWPVMCGKLLRENITELEAPWEESESQRKKR